MKDFDGIFDVEEMMVELRRRYAEELNDVITHISDLRNNGHVPFKLRQRKERLSCLIASDVRIRQEAERHLQEMQARVKATMASLNGSGRANGHTRKHCRNPEQFQRSAEDLKRRTGRTAGLKKGKK